MLWIVCGADFGGVPFFFFFFEWVKKQLNICYKNELHK